MGFVWKSGDVLTGDDVFVIFIFRDVDEINYFVLLEYGVDWYSFFEESVVKVNFGGDVIIVNLNFYNVSFFLF